MKTVAACALTAFLATLLAGCAVTVPAPVLLTLPQAAPLAAAAAAAPSAPGSAPLLAVRRVAIPEYLVARRVRYRADPATLAEWPNTYWAERVEIGVTREFIAALRAQLPGWTLCETNCADSTPALSLQVDMPLLDYQRPAQKLVAQARITIGVGSSASPVRAALEQSFEIATGTDTPQAQAQAMTELLRRIAAAAAPLVKSAAPP